MFNDMYIDIMNWWLGNKDKEMGIEEFERLESKHTRIRHDEDIREIIRVH